MFSFNLFSREIKPYAIPSPFLLPAYARVLLLFYRGCTEHFRAAVQPKLLYFFSCFLSSSGQWEKKLIFVRLIFSRLTRPVPDVRIKINSFTGGNMFINEQSLISLNGMPQYVSIRAQKKDAPLLLYLHGGPGDAALPLVMKFNRGLEENFTVVVWEQRGAGKSYYRFEDGAVTMETFLQDLLSLTAFLPAEQIGKGVAPGKKEGSDQLVVIGFSIKRTFVLYHLLRNKKQIGKPVVTGVGAVYCPKPFQGLTVGMCQSVFTGCAAGFLHVDYLAAADVGFHQLRMPRGEGKSQNAAP